MSSDVLGSMEIASLVAATEGEDRDSSLELLQVFADGKEPIGVAPRLLCHRLGLLHKVVFCFVGASDGRLLLQTRKGGRLDVTVGGHLNSEDNSAEEAILREVYEELGLRLDIGRVTKIAEFKRKSPNRISKPHEINNELRVLFFVQLTDAERRSLDARFAERQDKKSVLAVQWFPIADVLTACDEDKAADGLVGCIPQYLVWANSQRSPVGIKP